MSGVGERKCVSTVRVDVLVIATYIHKLIDFLLRTEKDASGWSKDKLGRLLIGLNFDEDEGTVA